MRVGVTLPQTEMGPDPIAIRDYVQAVEQLGYHHINSLDHVLGANTESRPGWQGPHDHNDLIQQHEQQRFRSARDHSCCSR